MLKPKTTREVCLTALALTVLLFALMSVVGGSIAPAFGQSKPNVFEQVWRTVKDRFFDPNFNGVDWQAMRMKYAPQASQVRSQAERAAVINKMLTELQTSHTRLYSPDEPAYYQLLGIFLPGNDRLRRKLQKAFPSVKPQYVGIGIFTDMIDGKTFVRAVLDGGPAAKAGLMVGDQLVQVGGRPFHPIRSFTGKTDQPVKLLIQRSPEPDSRREITVVPRTLDGTTMFLDALKSSVQVTERDGHRIGYVHVWSYAGEQYQRALERELLLGRLRSADALILDLREGWGGASPSYLNIFTPRTLSVTGTGRGRRAFTFSSGWSKPVVLLVNKNTRSGKELLAYGFRKHGIGPIVGTRTAGAVVAGSLSVMDDGSLLYLAVQDVLVDGDHRLEGVGVAPDVEVTFALPYAQGVDLQKDRAIMVALELAKRSNARH